MSRIDLHIIPTADCSQSTFDELIQFLLPEMNSELFKLHTPKANSKVDMTISALPSFEELFDLADQYRIEQKIPNKAFVFVVTEHFNKLNFFCALANGDSRSGFIHAKSWKYAAPDLSIKAEASANAYLVYSLILRRFQYKATEHPEYTHVFRYGQFVHRDARACFNNWVVDKRLIENLLNSVFICSSCQRGILAGGLSNQHFQIVKKVFERIRQKVMANDEIDSFDNGQLYVFRNYIEIVYPDTENYLKIDFSEKVGFSTSFTFYVYLLLMNRTVDLLEWNDNPYHFNVMRRIVQVSQNAVLTQALGESAEERFKELNVLKKFGTLNPRRNFEFMDPKIATFIFRVNEKIIKVFEKMGLNKDQAQITATEYKVTGERDLVLSFDRSRVFFADCWMNEFKKEFPHLQGMPE